MGSSAARPEESPLRHGRREAALVSREGAVLLSRAEALREEDD